VETKITAVGSIYALLSKLLTLACGFIIHIFLARWLGPEIYGLYGLIMSILIWVEFTVLVGIPSTYRKILSEDLILFDSVIYSIKRTFVPYCIGILAVFTCATPFIAKLFDDRRLLFLLLIAGIDIPLYGMFDAHNAILNGYRAFFKESVSNSFYILFKTSIIIFLILLGFGLQGALIGNVLASFFALLVAFFLVKKLKPHRDNKKLFDLKPRIMTFGFPFLLYTLAMMCLIHMDMWFVKGILNDEAMIGYYSVSRILSQPLFFLMGGISMVFFPSFSKALSEGNTWLLQRYIKQAMRFALLILFPLAMLIASTSDELVPLLFTSVYSPASSSLKILLLGIVSFSVFSLFLNLIAAENKPFYSFMISLSLIPIAIVLNYFLISSHGIEGAAMSTTIVSGMGAIISGIYLWRKIGVIVNFTILLRVILATGCLYILSQYITTSGYYLILEYLLLSLIYLGLLFALREINRGDLIIIKETFYPLLKRRQLSKTED